MIQDDPTFDDLAEAAAWIGGAPIAKVRAFLSARGVEALATVLGNLCRFESRSDADSMRIEAAMRCLKSLVKDEAGISAVIAAGALVCQSFASAGGSLLLCESEALLQPAVQVPPPTVPPSTVDAAEPKARNIPARRMRPAV